MDYNDRLWESLLASQANNELGAEVDSIRDRAFTISISTNEINAKNTLRVTSADLLKGIDSLKGTPPEQLKAMLHIKVDEMLDDVGSSLGWPEALKLVENFEVCVKMTGYNGISLDELEIDLSDYALGNSSLKPAQAYVHLSDPFEDLINPSPHN